MYTIFAATSVNRKDDMSVKNPGIAVMRRVLKNEIPLAEIPQLPSRILRVHAAVGYMIWGRAKYLSPDFIVLGDYGQILSDLTGERGVTPSLLETSLRSRLHVPVKQKDVSKPRAYLIIPPPELKIAPPPAIPSEAKERAKALSYGAMAEGRRVAYATYLELGRHFKQ